MKTTKVMRTNKHVQRGVIFLALILVLFATGGTAVLSVLNNRQTAALAQQQELHYQMEQAKAALLAYAANNAVLHNNTRGPGFFPCPDTDNDGQPQTTCSFDVATTGRLPEYQDFSGSLFHFNDAYANIDEQFWYVVGPRYLYYSASASDRRRSYRRTYANSPVAINASQYRLTLDGETEYVALIIAPGAELSSQDRSSGLTNYANYLDGQNGGSGFNFFTSYSSNPALFNDRVLGITLDEYMLYVGAAVARSMKPYLDTYNEGPGGGSYPVDNGSSTSYTTTGTCGNTTAFSNSFESGHVWLRDSSSGNSNNQERWSCRYGTYWDLQADADIGILQFNGCPGLSFTLEYGGGITRNGNGC